ncbi:ferritin-like domain-containing protein [Mycolicibacterium baixiangningiae]|uniref:ferritin-like domain-containing protein n=1 Tax=Mycolicibacterium baixiangningiae TaxID=2761578 RepID=UPI0018D0E8BD|nr:ferritin-like domain-containing protein [Mycolicibacterium baixiangningiae]
MTSVEPTEADPPRPTDASDGALYDAIATEHATIYGYGLVSAHSAPEVNWLVSASIAEHRERREAAIALLEQRQVAPPLPAAGYQVPMRVDDPSDAAKLAVRMEEDGATAWRAVVEQAADTEYRSFGLTALTQSAVAAARWTQIVGTDPVTVAFPGGAE